MSHRIEHRAVRFPPNQPPNRIGESWIEEGTASQDSAEFNQTARGYWQMTIKCYYTQGDLVAGKAAVERAYQIWQDAAREFPLVPAPLDANRAGWSEPSSQPLEKEAK